MMEDKIEIPKRPNGLGSCKIIIIMPKDNTKVMSKSFKDIIITNTPKVSINSHSINNPKS